MNLLLDFVSVIYLYFNGKPLYVLFPIETESLVIPYLIVWSSFLLLSYNYPLKILLCLLIKVGEFFVSFIFDFNL